MQSYVGGSFSERLPYYYIRWGKKVASKTKEKGLVLGERFMCLLYNIQKNFIISDECENENLSSGSLKVQIQQ